MLFFLGMVVEWSTKCRKVICQHMVMSDAATGTVKVRHMRNFFGTYPCLVAAKNVEEKRNRMSPSIKNNRYNTIVHYQHISMCYTFLSSVYMNLFMQSLVPHSPIEEETIGKFTA